MYDIHFLIFAQDIVRINMTSEKKEFSKNEVFAEAAEKAKATNGRLHLLGLVSKIDIHVLITDINNRN